MNGEFEARAFAKINLDLRILRTRADGFHELATVFQTIGLSDHLRLDPLPASVPLAIECNDPSVPRDARNLVWRAAAALWAEAHPGEPTGVKVTLTKNIPAGGGLGGGSADAAIALALLARFWGFDASQVPWHRLAAGLGSDVAFFHVGGTALGLGRGEQLQSWPDVPPLDVVLVLPPFGVSTADAYRWYDQTGPDDAPEEPLRPPQDWRERLAACRNDLQAAVFQRHPVLGQARAALEGAGARLAMMSGSGSTVFGLFDQRAAAERAMEMMADQKLDARLTRTINRGEYELEAFGGRALLEDSPIV